MSTDLPADVQMRASDAAESRFVKDRMQFGAAIWPNIVDAVAAVVAPEITRPLQARIAELEGQLQRAESSGTGWVKAALQLGGNEERLQARVELLSTMLRTMARVSVQYRRIVRQNLHGYKAEAARVELLTAALTGVVEHWNEEIRAEITEDNYVEEGVRLGLLSRQMKTRARAALAAGTTESEAP